MPRVPRPMVARWGRMRVFLGSLVGYVAMSCRIKPRVRRKQPLEQGAAGNEQRMLASGSRRAGKQSLTLQCPSFFAVFALRATHRRCPWHGAYLALLSRSISSRYGRAKRETSWGLSQKGSGGSWRTHKAIAWQRRRHNNSRHSIN